MVYHIAKNVSMKNMLLRFNNLDYFKRLIHMIRNSRIDWQVHHRDIVETGDNYYRFKYRS